MSNTVALVPARSGSKGIIGKNFRMLGDRPLFAHAIDCAHLAGCDRVVLSTDNPYPTTPYRMCYEIERPAHLAQDDTPMYDVVKHAAETLQLANEDVIVLLQPTQPFRTPARVREAAQMLRETGADSVVSVVRWPQQYSPDFVCHIMDGQLWAYGDSGDGWSCYSLSEQPTRRQDAFTGWKRDGTVYTLYTRTLRSGTLYGSDVRPLILDPSESCEMDTEQDWQAVERRWEEREQPKPEGAWPIECLGCGRFNPKTATACLYCTQELPR